MPSSDTGMGCSITTAATSPTKSWSSRMSRRLVCAARAWPLALWLLITLRVALGLVAVLSIHLQPVTMIGGDWLNLIIRSGRPWSDLLSTWQRWDALWYQQIAEHGYHAGDGTSAFYPLYPLLVRIVSLPLGVLMAFIVMYYQGVNANIMSLGGIAIAIGAMVDAAIVMIENAHKRLERAPPGTPRGETLIKAAVEVGLAVRRVVEDVEAGLSQPVDQCPPRQSGLSGKHHRPVGELERLLAP